MNGQRGTGNEAGREERSAVGSQRYAERQMIENEDTMKRQKGFTGWYVLTTVLLLVALLSGCSKKAEEPAAEAEKTYYTCPMHPQIIRDAPGTCPICNMDLVPVEEGGDHAGHEGMEHDGTEDGATEPAAPGLPESGGSRPVVRIDPSVARNIGVRTATVARRPLSTALRVDGRVVPEEGRVRSVTARVGGYAEKVRANASGLTVRKDEVLLEVYAPEVVVAQERLLQAGEVPGAAEESRRRLVNWDVPQSFIKRVERTGRAERLFPVVAPVSGVILRKDVIEGQGLMPGAELYRIADLSTVWVTARVWQADLAWVRPGVKASIRLRNLPGRTFASEVFFVSPELDPATRTAEIRMRVANTPASDLRPEMFAEVVLQAAAAPVLAVPAQAMIRAGGRDVAVVALGGGRFQPREVVAGREADGWIEIVEGVEEGEEVVTSAQFLIDSESNLRAAVEALRAEGAATPSAKTQGGGHVH